jgi:RNA polymerase sigma-70 factor (ECF subfamily)
MTERREGATSESGGGSETRRTADREVIEQLVANHRQFLAFLQSRVHDRSTAEDILQSAFVRSMEKVDTVRDTDSVVAWFYRLLRNALIDHYRKTGKAGRAVDLERAEAELSYEPELKGVVCGCVKTLLPTLKPEYAEMIRRVDLGEESVSRVADELGLSANNATVRLHRARQGLKKQLEQSCGTCATHGCLDCRCAESKGGGPSEL